ncbi:MAG: hypothetical protein KC475_05360 [Cyanobacteria bacterium HKST-UBA03]|nr:hypothetical protein [Cyanobacteria bacterium HKST-UBA03]
MILILDRKRPHANDDTLSHQERVYQAIVRLGGQAVRLYLEEVPKPVQFAMVPGRPGQGHVRPEAGMPAIALADINVVYSRYMIDTINPNTVRSEDAKLNQSLFREIDSAFGSLLRGMDVVWVDHPDAYHQHMFKSYQYQLMMQAGLPVPDTVITNDPDTVIAFWQKHQGRVVYKPCWFGAFTSRLTEADLTPERLANLGEAPVNFQELIDGTDVWIYAVGRQLFAAEVCSNHLDSREPDEALEYRPIELPEPVKHQCFELMDLLNLRFAAIDTRRRDSDGTYFFFEGNPSPVFEYFEGQTGYPVCQTLAQYLIDHDR